MNKINASNVLGQQEPAHGTPHFPFQALSQEDENGQYFAPYHWHSEVELLYVTEGSVQLKTERDSQTLSAGQLQFINPGIVHGIFGNSPRSHHYALVFPLSLLSFAQYDICQDTLLTPLLSGTLQFPDGRDLTAHTIREVGRHIEAISSRYLDFYHKTQPPADRRLLDALPFSYAESSADTAPLSIKIALLQIIELLYREHAFVSNHSTKKAAPKNDSLKTIFSYIEACYADKITLEDLSSVVHMNKNYFCKYFKEKTGMTPFSYLNEYRINQASMQLLLTDAPITDVAFASGFDNMSYFIRQFKHYKGCTPSAFRQKENP